MVSFEEDFKLVKTVVNYAFSSKYSNYKHIAKDLFQEAYLYIFKKFDEFKEMDEKKRFYNYFIFSLYAFNSYLSKYKKGCFIDFGDKHEESTNSNIMQVTVATCETPEDYLSYKELYNIFLNFLKSYDKLIAKIFYLQFIGYSFRIIATNFNISVQLVKKYIIKFREDFRDHLNNLGLYSILKDVSSDLKSPNNVVICKRRYVLKKLGIDIDYSLYSNDYFILKLLRNVEDLTPYAECLSLSIDELKVYLYHTRKGLNFTLYNIQKLRKNFFPNYSLYDLTAV